MHACIYSEWPLNGKRRHVEVDRLVVKGKDDTELEQRPAATGRLGKNLKKEPGQRRAKRLHQREMVSQLCANQEMVCFFFSPPSGDGFKKIQTE